MHIGRGIRRRALTGVLILAAGRWGGVGAAESDFLFGRWSLDPAGTHYAREAPPQRMFLLIEPAPDGLEYRSDAEYAGGRASSVHFVARLDGTPALVVGTTGFLAPVSLSPAGANSIDAVYTSGRKKVAWSRWAVNADGSELLVTTTYLDKDGAEIQNVAAFRRGETP